MTIALTRKEKRTHSDIGQRLVFIVLALNAALSILATAVQLSLSYQRDRSEVVEMVNVIDASFRGSFESALWEFNDQLVEALLDGVANNTGIATLHLTTSTGRYWERGEPYTAESARYVLNFTHPNSSNEPVAVGTLEIELSFAQVRSRVWAQFLTVLASNFAKTAVASIALLAIFHRRITKHLRTISDYVASKPWLTLDQPLMLDRSESSTKDDIDAIVDAINSAQVKSHQDYAALHAETNQRQRAEAALRAEAKALAQANREQAEFTYAISHDLKSPSNTIRMLLEELVELDGERLSEEGQEFLSAALRTNKRMGRLIDDILAYARTVHSDPQAIDIHLNDLIASIIEDLSAEITQTQATIDVADLPTIRGSETQIRLLFQNLISNALKFRSDDRLPKIEIGVQPDGGGGFRFWVRDNGIGIESEYLDKIFGLFHRLHNHAKYPGSGIGLAVCQRVAINHDGRIWVTSEFGKGTTFWIALP